MKLILEQRYLFDGSVAATSHHAFSGEHHHHGDRAEADAGPWHGHHGITTTAPAIGQPELNRPGAGETVLFVDQTVTDWQQLIAGVKPGVDVIVLNPNQDGIDQVTQALAGLHDVKTIEFLTDGTPGSITLGSTTLDAATLSARASEITGWSAHLAANADVVFWGCDVGQGSAGQAFVDDVHTLTGATVGASSTAVGSAALGGDWTLNVTTGSLGHDVNPFTASTLAAYTGILDTPNPTVSMTVSPGITETTPGTVLLGDTLTTTITFANGAENATGYGPYVEVFVPTALTLSGSASYNGANLTDLTALVSGGSVINPLTKLSESAPAGFTSGELYVIEIPYGSFTPGEPAISISATFTMATSTVIGSALTIDARGGFEYGAVATGGSNIEGSSVSTSDTVELIESYATVATNHGEDETATGPDFPVAYTLTFIAAPAVTSGNPIDNLTTSLELPNGVVWTGGALTASVPGVTTASVTSASADGGTVQTVNIDFATLSGAQTVTIPVYVPQFYQYTNGADTVGTPILSPSTGAPVLISISPPYDYSANAWDGNTIADETGDVSGAGFYAKSLAVQLTAAQSNAVPGEDINYTLTFQVSDYFGISGLTLNALMSNGLTFDPTITPQLSVTAANGGVGGSYSLGGAAGTTATINNETVQTGGGGTNWSYTFSTGTDTTAITFNLGQQVPGMFGAGTVGSVTFSGTILDAYPSDTDNVAGAGAFLREGDQVSTSSSSNPATLYDYNGSDSYSASVATISDDTATPVDTLPDGSVTLQVAYVDGVAYDGQTINPGDTVIYELVYTLPDGGNFANLSMTAYLPEPVFSAVDPANPNATTSADYAGSGSFLFSATTPGSLSALTSGSYTYVLSSGLATDGVTVGGGTGAEPTNGVTFTAQSPSDNPYYNSGNNTGQTIAVYLAVTASSEPFVNGLHLTAQGDSSFTPAHAATFTTQSTAELLMGEPSLSIDQGVVSIVDGSGGAAGNAATGGITWSNGASSPPSSVFAVAGSAGVFVTGTGPAALSAATDSLDVSGAYAGDIVRIVDAVQNTGGYAAYDVILKDALAQGLTTGDIQNLTFTLGNGTALEVMNPDTGQVLTGSAAVTAFFSGGVLLVNGGSTGNAVLSATGSTADIVYVTYDITLPTDTPTAASLTGQASIVGFSNQDVYSYTGTSYALTDSNGNNDNFADDTALGLTLTASATVATAAPTISDTITGGSDASDPSATVPTNSYDSNTVTAVPGETLDLQATIALPQGQNTDLVLTDILPAGLTPITTAGSFTVTLTSNAGGGTTDLTADAHWSGQSLVLTLPTTMQVNAGTSGDAPDTVTVDYQALVPQTSATALSGSAIHNTTVTDSFAANSEGLSYGTTTETATSTTDGTANASGVANHVTVTNPVVTASLTELGGTNGQNVYSGEQITYQLTLTNTSTSATAYDVGTNIALPSGLTYVAGTLSTTSSGALDAGNIGSDGTAPSGDAISGLTLAPGATVTLTFEATVDNNLPTTTVLKVTSQPDWNSLPDNATVDGAGNVNPNAQAYLGAKGSVQNNVAAIAPTLSVVGSSNDTAGLGTADNNQLFDPNGETSATAVAVTDGEIVRMRATLQLPEGENNDVTMTITLPTGLTLDPNYTTDGSVTILLVSPGGDIAVTPVMTSSGLELVETGGGINTGKLDLGTGNDSSDAVVATLPTSAISVSGQTVTINLGELTNNDGSPLPNYAMVEFNAVVGAVAGGTKLDTTLQGSANGSATTTATDYLTVDQPSVSLAKQVTGITYNADGSATVTYVDTITNNGDGTAYSLSLTDPGAGVGTLSYLGTSGSGTGVTPGASGSSFDATIASLAAGGAQSFTYTVTIPQNEVTQAVSDSASLATVTSSPLNPVHEVSGQEVLTTTSVTPSSNLATASAGLNVVSGTVNQDVSPTEGADASLDPLADQTITVSFTGQTGSETVSTAADGSYDVLVPDHAASVTITVTASGSNVPANDVLDNLPAAAASLSGTGASTTGSNPAMLTFTPASNTNYTGVTFDFWHALDTAPVLANAPGGAATFTSGGAPIALFPAATVTDAQLDAAFGQDFSGTTLTVQRYVSGTATPTSGDVFAGAGTTASGLYLNTSNDQVLYNGAAIGTFSEVAGKLTISFAGTGVSQTMVDEVLQGLTYSYAGAPNPPSTGVTFGIQIDDANNDPIGLNGVAPDPSGPHDQGPGGDLLSNVLMSTVDIVPPPVVPTLSVVGSSNDTAGLGTQFDPNGTTSGTAVLTTDGDIVRMRATLQLTEGDNTGVELTVTLPTGLTFQNDGSVTLLLVSPNGDLTPVTLTLSGNPQLAEGAGINTAKLDLGTGADTTDPVVVTLPASAISVSGQTVTFNLGELTNYDGSTTVANYAMVEFNAVVGANVAGGTNLVTTMTGQADGNTTATVSDYLSVEAPDVSLTKQVSEISYNPDGSATITYVDTITNNGDGPAYAVNLADPGAGLGTVAYIGTSGTGTGVTTTPNGSSFDATLTSLGAGGAQSFTYTVTIPANAVGSTVTNAASTATVTSSPLNPAHEVSGQETLAGTTEAPPTEQAQASAGLDAVSGTVNQDVSPTEGTDSPLVGLNDQTVSVSFTGQTGSETVSTAADGSYTVLVPDSAGTVTITTSASGPDAPANDALDNLPAAAASLAGTGASATGSNPVALSFTPAASTGYTGVAFDFWHALDTAPVLADAPGGATTFVVGSTPIALFPDGTASDHELNTDFGNDFSGTTLTVQRYVSGTATPDAGDVFTGTGTTASGLYLNTSNDQVLYNGAAIGTFSEVAGKLTISFASTGVSNTIVNDVLEGLAYSYTGAATTLTPGVTIGAQIDDANNDPIGLNGFAPDPAGPHDQGPGGDLLSNVLISTVNVAPAAFSDTFTEPNDANPANAPYPVVVDGAANLPDISNTAAPPSQITLAITNAKAEDVLAFTNTAEIQGVYANGTLTLTAVSGQTPTIADWQAALRSVTYYDTSPVPFTVTRDVTVTVTDGANSSSGTGTIAIVPVDDSPILNTTVPVTLNDATEYQGTGTPVPSGVEGTPVSQLVGLTTTSGPGNVTDSDGPGLTNGGVPTTMGIAITGINNTDLGGTPEGTWYYSTNNGVTWTAIPTAVSAQHPLDLDASALVYFQPTAQNYNGQIVNALTFRAWDGFDNTADGAQADLTGVTVFGQNAADNTAATAYSIATETLSLMVDNVNNAPLASGTEQLPTISSDDRSPQGETATQLFTGNFNDSADQQYSATGNPYGSTANTLAGVAVTGDAAPSSQGYWEYSLNGGASWTVISPSVSSSAALILPATAKLAFQPENGFSGTPGALTLHLIDSSDTTIQTGLTGLSLAAETNTAYSGVNVTNDGGSTAVSANTVTLDTFITPVPPPITSTSPAPPAAPPPGTFPDDLTYTGDPNIDYSDDFLAREIIPQLDLIGSEADHYVIVDQQAVIALPPDMFQDSMPNPQLTYEAKRPDGTPLPPWLTFDATDLTFYGTPPDSAVGRVDVVITATDIADNTADATFSILVGHKESDLIGLISGRRPGGVSLSPGQMRHLPLAATTPAPDHRSHAAHAAQHAAPDATRHDATHHDAAHHAAAATAPAAGHAAEQTHRPAARLGGLSGALRAAGPMGALSRARSLLDALDSLNRSRPAA